MLEVIRDQVALNSESWIVDFEKGAISAIEKKYFPNVTKGYYFHLQQYVYRKVIELGSKTNYENNGQSHQIYF